MLVLLLPLPSLAESTGCAADLALLLDRTHAALAGDRLPTDELSDLARQLAAPTMPNGSPAPDHRLARRAFAEARAVLAASLGSFELEIAAEQVSAARRRYRDELLPLFFDLAVCLSVIDEGGSSPPKER